MATETATIRVSRSTRDRLAREARARGVSLASLLADVAREREAQSIWRAERQASRLDAENPAVSAEERAWETAIADGIE